MRILFTSGNGWLPEAIGGTQISTHHIIQQASSDGHECAVYCGLVGRGAFGLHMRLQRKLRGRKFSIDHHQGYSVMRTWTPFERGSIRACVADFRPDVAVVQAMGAALMASEFQALGIPVVMYLRNVEFEELGGDISSIDGVRFIANSNFTARAYRDKYGISATIIPPTIEAAKFRSEGPRSHATLINVHPNKGYAIAREVARACPEIPFLFVQGWTLDPDEERRTRDEISELPNVALIPRTPDIASIYGRTKVLLAPSQWEEAWGRVASEAHCSGIPVIGSDRGGLPEAIGPGGIVLRHDAPVQDWVDALRGLWTDAQAYSALSDAARAYAARPQLDTRKQYATFMEEIDRALGIERLQPIYAAG